MKMGRAEVIDHHLKQTTPTTEKVILNNVSDENVHYQGFLYAGTPIQYFTNDVFAYDSSAGYTAISSKACDTCYYPYYNSELSSTANFTIAASNPKTTLEWGHEERVSLTGYMMADYVCIDGAETLCLDQCQFFNIEASSGDFKLFGMIGLAPNFETNGPNFMGEMINEGKLEHPVISWQFNFDTSESYCIFGGFNATAYTGDLIQYDIVQTVNWTIGLNGVWLDDTEINGGSTN